MRTLRIAIAIALALFAAACSKATQENFAKIQDGMSEQEVHGLLGKPSKSSSTSVLGISGTASKWVAGDAVITIRFVNGKVALKNFERGPAR